MINSSNKENKGFTMVELLATVVILGILAGIGVPLVYRYLNKARTNSYNHMLTGAYDAANNMIIENNYNCVEGEDNKCIFKLSSLVQQDYLEILDDPAKHGSTCDGVIKVVPSSITTGSLKSYNYICYLQCSGYSTTVKWESGAAADDYSSSPSDTAHLVNLFKDL